VAESGRVLTELLETFKARAGGFIAAVEDGLIWGMSFHRRCSHEEDMEMK
jgi:hypothetical protein